MRSCSPSWTFPPLGRAELGRRSVWRELSFFAFVVKSNVLPLKEAARDFSMISRLFLVEKRVKTRDLQLQT